MHGRPPNTDFGLRDERSRGSIDTSTSNSTVAQTGKISYLRPSLEHMANYGTAALATLLTPQ
jgi:hypothetical protein